MRNFVFFVVVNIGLLSHCLEPSHKKKVIFFLQHQYFHNYDNNALRFKYCGGIMDDLDSER